MVVGVHRRVVATWLAHQLQRAVSDHFIHVHVRRRARAPLNHVDEKVLMMAAGADLLRGAHSDVGNSLVEQAELRVGERRRFLHRRERFDKRRELTQGNAGDGKIFERAERLHAVESVIRHVAIAEQIVLPAGARTGESERAAMADERRIGCREPPRDCARCSADERRVQGRIFLDHLVHLLGGEHERLGALNRARASAMRRVVKEKTFPEGLAGAKGHEANWTSLNRLLDRYCTRAQDGEKAARCAFVEEDLVALEGASGDESRELVEGGLGESLEKLRLAQLVANR